MDLPFSRTQFLEVFANYNTAIWPFQILAAALGVVAIALLFWRPSWADRMIAGILAAFWAVIAIGYHWLHFSTINPAAYFFAVIFLLAAVVFFVEGVLRGRIEFVRFSHVRGWIAALLITFSLLIYPLLSLLATHPYPQTPLFGVTPCPTTIFTLGFLLLAKHRMPLLLAAIPLVWGIVGGSAAFLLDVPQDLGLLAAAVLWIMVYFALPTHSGARRTT
jgi:hypothetical protein